MQVFFKVNKSMKIWLKKSTSSDFSCFGGEVICRSCKVTLSNRKCSLSSLEKFCQDPLEEDFGAERRSGGCNKNPNLFQFQNQEQRRNVMGSSLMTDMTGNTKRQNIVHPAIKVNDTRNYRRRERKTMFFKN